MIRLIDSRTFEQFETDALNHASQVSIKHADGYYFRLGSANYDNSFCAGSYARLAASAAFKLHPELRIH